MFINSLFSVVKISTKCFRSRKQTHNYPDFWRPLKHNIKWIWSNDSESILVSACQIYPDMCVYFLAPDHVMIAPQLAVPFSKTTSRVDFLHRNYLNMKSFSWEFSSWSSTSLFNFVTSLHFFIRTSYKTILHYYV